MTKADEFSRRQFVGGVSAGLGIMISQAVGAAPFSEQSKGKRNSKSPEGTKAASSYPLPTWSPIFDPLPVFRNTNSVSILCRAEPGALDPLAAYPLKYNTEAGAYLVITIARCEAVVGSPYEFGNNHGLLVCNLGMPAVYKGQHGTHNLIEYTNDEMLQIAGREMFGWPKKLAEIKLGSKRWSHPCGDHA
jgi:acetoacetate decarboxylase